jgi:hypothetical protein
VHHTAMSLVWAVDPHPHATDAESPGNFRRHEIAEFPGGMKPPSWIHVDALMNDWLEEANQLSDDSDTPLSECLARLHNRFERVHPFLDGNGRTGRLILNLMLGRLGYPPAIVYERDRDKYLQAMRRADREEHGPLGELIARSVTTNLLSVRAAGGRWPGEADSAGGTRQPWPLRKCSTCCGRPWTAAGRQGRRWHVAKQQEVGQRLRSVKVQTSLTRPEPTSRK